MTQSGETENQYLNSVSNAPKNIEKMKNIIRPHLASDHALSQRMTDLCKFEIRWQRLTLAQAYIVWLAWQVVQGDPTAALILGDIQGVQVQQQEQFTPEEVHALRTLAEDWRAAYSTIAVGWNLPVEIPKWLEPAVRTLIIQRNEALAALRLAKENEEHQIKT